MEISHNRLKRMEMNNITKFLSMCEKEHEDLAHMLPEPPDLKFQRNSKNIHKTVLRAIEDWRKKANEMHITGEERVRWTKKKGKRRRQ